MTIQYAASGKRDFHQLERMFDKRFSKLESTSWENDDNRKLVIKYIQGCRRGMVKSRNRNARVLKSTLYRIVGILELLSEVWIRKSFSQTTQEDWDKFYIAMEDGAIRNANGKAFKQSTRSKNYRTIQKFLRWLNLDHLCENWDTSQEIPTRDVLTRAEVERMAAAASPKVKCHLMILFDGGFRAEEFANLRWADLKKREDGHYQASVRAETSKTKRSRIVSLWLATDWIDILRNMARAKGEYQESDFLYQTDYHSLLRTLKRLGKRVLSKNVSPHLLRHSSATYYAGIIKTYQNFCFRYGWSLKSGIAQRYWHPTTDDEIAQQTKDHEVARFKTQVEKLDLENASLRDELKRLESQFSAFKDDFHQFFISSGEADRIRERYLETKQPE